jgi:hypothetical protein
MGYYRLGLLGGLLLGGMWASCCFGQGKATDFIATKSWAGTVSIKGSGSGSSNGGGIKDTWSFSLDSEITLSLDTFDPLINGWRGTFKGTGKVVAEDKSVMGNCTQTFSQNFNGVLGDKKTFFLLFHDNTNDYVFNASDPQVAGGTNRVTSDCAPGNFGGDTPVNWGPVLSLMTHPFPAKGQPLAGTYKTKMPSPMQPASAPFGGTPAEIDVTVTWEIKPGAADDLEVVVLSSDAYKQFRPEAGPKGTRGNSLDLTAELRTKSGGPLNTKVAQFTWEFTQCSKEPGYALNAPLADPSSDFDFKIEAGPDGLQILDPPRGQKAQTKVGEYTKSTVTIASYDWGGFGKIKVTALMPDQKMIVGYLEGDPSQMEVRVPKRTADGVIAESWKKTHGIDSADTTDSETDPQGDGTPGDGLTLYEEYRGFIIGGNHEEGDPKKKDHFVLNFGGAQFKPAFKLFEANSGLKVHSDLTQYEVPANRVINRNHSEGPHIVDQHVVTVVPIAADTPYAVARGGPGTPKSIDHIECPMIPATSGPKWGLYVLSSLTHELFHSVNVYHHGDRLMSYVTWTRTDADTIVEQAGDGVTDPSEIRVVHIINEAGQPNEAWLPLYKSVQVCLGLPDDPHVGPDFCVMRYDNANGYPSQIPFVRYYIGREDPGFYICNQTQGTGVNDPDRSPQARYGDCAQGRGHCKTQVVVNDAANAPRR